MGEIRTKLLLVNADDARLARQGKLRRRKPRQMEVDAVVDTGAVMSVLPQHVVDKLGVEIRGQRVASYAEGRQDAVGVTDPVLFEILGRDTLEEALVPGDEVLIGQTVLEKLDLLADCARQRVTTFPGRPNQPVLKVR